MKSQKHIDALAKLVGDTKAAQAKATLDLQLNTDIAKEKALFAKLCREWVIEAYIAAGNYGFFSKLFTPLIPNFIMVRLALKLFCDLKGHEMNDRYIVYGAKSHNKRVYKITLRDNQKISFYQDGLYE